MDPIWLLLLLPLAGLSGWVAARRTRYQGAPPSASKALSGPYVRSINFLANDQHDEALDVLTKALEDHDQSLEIQLALGTLFRRRGEIEKATQIHQSLISRAGTSPEQKSLVLFELANDYFKAGLLDRAENLLLELGVTENFREASLRLLVQIYESEREWERAIAAAKALDKIASEALAPQIAQFQCEMAERALVAGDHAAAKDRATKALKLNRNCARAIILRGRLEALSGKHRQAIATWSRLCVERPELLHEVSKLVQTSAESVDDDVVYLNFLRRAIVVSSDERLQLLLADLLLQMKRSEEAEALLRSWSEEQGSLSGLHRLLEIRARGDATGEAGADYQLMRKVAGRLLSDHSGYECRFCGFQAKSMHWQCPGCRHWDTTTPRLNTIKLS
ncbi:MAG TPA: hypothetical protein DCW50_00575 [Gammaproteobacteria bacterium]|nr:hypothetical protein [Gammaproteobacteria bacterium]|tara:strand:+ start:11134 stop:12312 length:1179 start_codon:yes stop_codon:yes gene_type:complete